MRWADQTLRAGMDIPMERAKIHEVVANLKRLPVTSIDIKVRAWERYNLLPLNEEQSQLFRGIIKGTVEEVKLAHSLGFKRVIVGERLEQGDGLTKQNIAALRTGNKRNLAMGFLLENASQYSVEKIKKIWRGVFLAGAETFIYNDGDSLLHPLLTTKILGQLVSSMPGRIEFIAHNAYGLATANALGAIQAGVRRIGTAVAGVGCQGHAALEEILMAQKHLLGQKIGETQEIATICKTILAAIKVPISSTKAIIGDELFAHESGIHVDGVLKNPQLYEPFPPEEVGLTRKLVIGKHSGTASIQAKFRQWNVVVPELAVNKILERVRRLAVVQKSPITDQQLWAIYTAAVGE